MTLGETTTADLYARPTDAKATNKGDMGHAFWIVKGADGKYYVVSGGWDNEKSKKVHGDIVGWSTQKAALENGLYGLKAKDLSHLGTAQIDAKYGTLDALNTIRDRFNSTIGTRQYDYRGPNSNTYANWFGRQMGVNMPASTQTHYFNLHGWNWNP